MVEAGADLAGVAQRAAAVVVVADQQRAEAGARAGRVGPATDHQLLGADALELEPVRRAGPGPVGRVRPLGDQPFPPALAGLPQVGLAVGVAVGAEPDRVAGPHAALEQAFAAAQRQRGDVVAGDDRGVEQVEVHGHAGGPGPGRVGDPQPALQPGEAGLRPVERDHLAVGDEPGRGAGVEGLDQLGVGARDLLVVAGEQAGAVLVADDDQPLAVELALEDPAGVGEVLPGQRREHRLHELRVAPVHEVALVLGEGLGEHVR